MAVHVCVCVYTIHMYSGITSGRVLDGELLDTKILGVICLHYKRNTCIL